MGQREHAFFHRNQVFNVHLAADGLDLGAALVGKAFSDRHCLVLDNRHDFRLVGQNAHQLCDALHQRREFFLDLLPFQTGELSQAHRNDCLGLHVVQPETFHQGRLALGNRLGAAQNLNDLVDEVQRNFKAL